MATFFDQLGQDLKFATDQANALRRALPQGAAPVIPGAGGGMPQSVIRDIATIRNDQQRIRTALESSDTSLESFTRTER